MRARRPVFRPKSACTPALGMTAVILVTGAEPRSGDYLSLMRRLNFRSPMALDIGIVVVATALVEVASWVHPNPIGEGIAGPIWLIAPLPVLLTVPLLWRRTRPLLGWTVMMAAVCAQAIITNNSPEGLEMIFVWSVGSYSVAAYTTRRSAILGLLITLAGYGVYAFENRDIRTGKASELWAGAFFGIELLACWMFGRLAGERHERAEIAERVRRLDVAHERAVADERARLARELHDIVSHNLSVVVVQAAGARAQGSSDSATLEKIERSGRESLIEMRRLLDVLRADDGNASAAPQPRIVQLDALVAQVCSAGVKVDLAIDGDCASVPAAIDLSVYRIVQESLTNVLKHAGPARATVTVRRTSNAISVDIVDDGRGTSSPSAEDGHGLLGMRERVALFGGHLQTGARPEGGFQVSAILPLASTQ